MFESIKHILFMPCIFKEVTGLYCPVCGGTRAMLAFLRFQFVESFMDNPIFIYMVILAIWLTVGWILKKKGHPRAKQFEFRLWMLYVGLVILLIVFVGRNLGVYVFGYDFLGDMR